MLLILLILALIGTLILVFHVSIELNTLEKKITTLIDSIRKHYER